MVRIVHKGPRGERIVEIDIDDPGQPIAALQEVLGLSAGETETGHDSGLLIDGHLVDTATPLSAACLYEGSVVRPVGRDQLVQHAAPTPSTRALAVVGGVRAGAAVSVDAGVTVGRACSVAMSLDDITLSPHHLTVSAFGASLIDHGSRNGTSIDGHRVVTSTALEPEQMIRAGTTRLTVRELDDDVPVAVASGLGARGGTIPFNRPPRLDPPTAMVALHAPGPTPMEPTSEPLSVAGIVLPILAGGVMALVFSPFMAVFAVLGPVLTIGTWWERRRRTRREFRRAEREFLADMDDLRDALPGARRSEIRRRRMVHPDPAEVVRRAIGPSVRVWERRPGHADCFVVGIGADDEPFRPRLSAAGDGPAAAETGRLLAAVPAMPDVPVPVDLSAERTIGLVGDRAVCMAVARSLTLQMATHHGPADLAIAIGADQPRLWRWGEWLPHTADHASGRRGTTVLSTNDARGAEAVLAMQGARHLLVVLDSDDPYQGRSTVGRILAASGRASAIVLVRDEHRLPSTCDLVVRADALGRLTLVDPRRAAPGRPALGWGLTTAMARQGARRLARLDDPELPLAGAGVPSTAPLLRLLGVDGNDPAEIEARWRTTDDTANLAAPIGLDADGIVSLDLVGDGPHVLIGGTTGSGKSELLRSLVAGLAATADPDHLAMVLVDYKGGAAFDCCADLPHVAGLVTDLDDSLAARALRCLEAELHYRERRLRELGAEDLVAFRRVAAAIPESEPLPRLVVVVDEFASLASDLPDFVDALVGVAQRGRSLGVHMILATQRPAGVVTDDIRANTSCRIALRVTDRGDSSDVIGAPDAAAIPRSRPGRAVARFGPGELVPFQAALATGCSDGQRGVSVVSRFVEAHRDDRETDLARIVRTIDAAHTARGGRRPRSPWPPALPEVGDAAACGAKSGDWLLVDEPDQQRQYPDGWRPQNGHLCVVGAPGSGTTTTLAMAALGAAQANADDHLHVVDLDGGGLAPLRELPGAGTYCGPSDGVRRQRLIRWLDEEVARRRADPTVVGPGIVVVIDDFGGLARAHDPVREAMVHERIARVWADGPATGVVMAVSLRRAADLPPALAATVGEVLLHRTADHGDALRFGMSGSTEGFGPGRVVRSSDGATAQVLLASVDPGGDHICAAVGEHALPRPAVVPHEVGELAAQIPSSSRPPEFTISHTGCAFALGIRDRDLQPAAVGLHPGDHFLVLGQARSGKTNALAAIARSAGEHAIVVGGDEVASRAGLAITALSDLETAVCDRAGAIVLIDDCVAVDDTSGLLGRWVAAPPPGVHFVVSARPDRYRSAYGHWASDIKASRSGFLLRPDPIDGDILGQQLPLRLGLAPLPGRGVLIADATTEIAQVFLAESPTAMPPQSAS